MANESQFVEVIKQAKESDKDRKFNQSVEMIMVFRDVDVKKGFAISETVQLPKKNDYTCFSMYNGIWGYGNQSKKCKS